jgi:hypothetical protein
MSVLPTTETENQILTLSPTASAVVRTLLYFDIFKYPLLPEEIFENCQAKGVNRKTVLSELAWLADNQFIRELDGFYFLSADDSLVERRLKGNKAAQHYLLKAKQYTSLISRFPYVEAVLISGSLSKDFVDEQSDIDYFIITRPQRLWVCRTFLILFKKAFLLNSRKYFCVNYFIDSDNLLLPDQNMFTATELVFAKPFYNPELCKRFIETNAWRERYYPNKPVAALKETQHIRKGGVKSIAESALNRKAGEWLDGWCFRTTLKFWKHKFKNFDESAFDLNLRSRKNVSKHHPGGFQFKVLETHDKSMQEFCRKHNVAIAS